MGELPQELERALREYGLSNERISQLDMESTLVKDLRLSGDDFETFYRYLSKVYNSEKRIPEKYVPSELSSASLFVTLGNIVPFFNRFIATPPLSLRMIDKLMRSSDD